MIQTMGYFREPRATPLKWTVVRHAISLMKKPVHLTLFSLKLAIPIESHSAWRNTWLRDF